MNEVPVEELFIRVFVRAPKEKSRMRTVRTACLSNSRHSLSIWDTATTWTPFLVVTLKKILFIYRPEGLSSAETSTQMNAQNTVSSAGNRMMTTRLQSIIYMTFVFLWPHGGKPSIFQTKQGEMASKQQPVPRFMKTEVSTTWKQRTMP